jgi:hypothetical protein
MQEQAAGMTREWQQVTPKRRTRKARQLWRRRLKHFLNGNVRASATEYPGFFVLPRASSHSHPSEVRRSTRHGWWARLKLAVAVYLVFGGFIGVLAYIFSSVTPQMEFPNESLPALPIFDPKLQPTNSQSNW